MDEKIKVAIHYTNYMPDFSWGYKWEEELLKRGVEVKKVNFFDSNIMEQIKDCDGVMWHWFHSPEYKFVAPRTLPNIELNLNIPVFPDLNSCWHYDEKVAQHYLLDSINAPRIPSWVFYNYDEAINFIENAKYPLVFKLSLGAGSANVLKIDDKISARKMVDKMFKKGIYPYTLNDYKVNKKISKKIKEMIRYIKNDEYPEPPTWHYMLQKDYVYFQKFIPNNDHDIRITIIGNRAFAFIRYNRDNDFRASGSGKIDYDKSKIPIEAIKIAFEVSKKCKFQSMAYDFMVDENNKVLINEITYCYSGGAVGKCEGYWDDKLNWHEGKMRPEEAHIEDFLERIRENKKERSIF